ncbi:UNVERIFIED_ORG: RHS repeat-associated protein [Atlantibacter hermannii]|uniref:RHS repeat-associated core domain-containing protein n=2 Tax=Kosakonia cowanii TaxID=208223 RepID=UPI0027871F7A|nr:RHS repeat-associated protein [Atlantibacter hermannii]
MREPAHSEAIILARNKLGDLVREENHSGVYQHEYDALSNLSATTFPDGRELKFLRYGTGHLLEMQLSLSGKTLPVTGYQRDRLHRETHRTMGALELETHYDMAGRITHRRCTDNLRDRLVSERRYQWDRADQIIRRMYTDGAPSTPAEKYRQSLWGYDAAGRMTQSLQPEGEERFWYDAADNRTTPELQPVWNNLLKRLDGVSREYDGLGRMIVRHDTHRRVMQRFSYDEEHRISRVEIDGDAEFTKAEYRYDALGRRTEKQVWRRHARKPERTQYAWSGLQMVGETSDSHPDAAVQYIYTENSYEPLARVDSHGEHADIFWYHTELNGLPDSVTDSNGDTVWRGASTAWGRSLRESTPVEWDTPQNLRFQGQYLDRETGLHYNTFRYYDPAGGCYTQMDPIGLAGGLNTYTYVVDPLGWVDPLGLVKNCTPEWKSRRTFKKGDSGLKVHARRHSNLTAEEYLSLGRKNITDGRMLKGGKYRNARYHIRKIGEDNYSLTIADKNNKILSIDTWKNGGAPLTKVDILRGLEKSGVTPPKDFWEKL